MFYENKWVRMLAVLLFMAIFLAFVIYSVSNDTSGYLVRVLSQKSFPFEIVLLEGMPGFSSPERVRLDNVRYQAVGLGMFLLTGVNISDARTYFLSYYAPPREGPAWLGWAYYPHDPEMEGPILEPLEEPFIDVEPVPAGSDDVIVGIYHTHNGENYAGNEGLDRTAPGENGDVVKVGEALAQALNEKGVKTVHYDTVNDEIYAKSYENSYETAKNMLEEYPTIQVLLDVHRDGLPPGVGKSTIKIGTKEAGKILVVLGQKNPHWEKNRELAEKIIEAGNQKYPGLIFNKVRYASQARYNQHLSNGALLLEIGSQLNTVEEVMESVEPLAEVLKVCLEK